MPLDVTWKVLVLRLACALIAGAIIGFNRGEHGKSAGLRTTILVCVAAAVAMLQMNYLLSLNGRHTDSFVMNDLMRLPLGILTGVGFIGGGAILRRGDMITGVTTAATLWYVTVLGLCFGGGQLELGWAATLVGCVVLWGLKSLEAYMPVESRATVTITVDADTPEEGDLRAVLRSHCIAVRSTSLEKDGNRRTYVFTVVEDRASADQDTPSAMKAIGSLAGVSTLRWERIA